MKNLILVMLGSAFGGGARYLLAGWIHTTSGGSFPFGTLAVNAVGSLLIGFILQLGASPQGLDPDLRLALTTGVLGGFTTYSTFNHETLALLSKGSWGYGVANLSVTLVGCLGAGALGMTLARLLGRAG